MADYKGSRFDNPDKGREWHTAFYYLAEHLKDLTDKEINHKKLYSFVCTQGSFVNHDNPKIRKDYASVLSKLMHSKGYASEMCLRYLENARVFDEAAQDLCSIITRKKNWTDEELSAYWVHECWPDVWHGLVNEKMEWRGTLDFARIEQEAKYVFGILDSRRGQDSMRAMTPVKQLSAMFRFISFGELDAPADLDYGKTLERDDEGDRGQNEPASACLVSYEDAECLFAKAMYILPTSRPFTIGRKTDSDAIESNRAIGREHGCVFRCNQVWYYEDRKSVNGSAIIRNGVRTEYRSRDEFLRVELQPGDIIEIARSSYYRFGFYSGHPVLPC